MPDRQSNLVPKTTPARVLDAAALEPAALRGSAAADTSEDYAHAAGLESLPNDLTRMLYLASLRDCNSGRYLHPHLSPRIGTEAADRALRACHGEVFRRLLATPPSGYAAQLEEYIRYAKAERETVLNTWQSLQAYRATVPLPPQPLASDLFCLNVEVALTILEARNVPA